MFYTSVEYRSALRELKKCYRYTIKQISVKDVLRRDIFCMVEWLSNLIYGEPEKQKHIYGWLNLTILAVKIWVSSPGWLVR